MLIMSKKTEFEGQQHYPVTTTVFECSDETCRDNTRKEREQQKAQKQARITQKDKHMQEMRDKKKQA